MLAVKIILTIIILFYTFVGTAFIAYSQNSFFGIVFIVLILLSSAYGLYRMFRSYKAKTIYLCIVAIASIFNIILGHLTAGALCGAYFMFYKAIFGDPNCFFVQNISLCFWVGFLLLTLFEAYRKTELKYTLFWKAYYVAAQLNILAIIGFCFYMYIKR